MLCLLKLRCLRAVKKVCWCGKLKLEGWAFLGTGFGGFYGFVVSDAEVREGLWKLVLVVPVGLGLS